MFAYCNNNPINHVDLTGNSPFAIGALLDVVVEIVAVGICAVAALVTAAQLAEKVKTWAVAVPEVTEYRGHSVYVLRDPSKDNLVQYVGRSTNPVERYKQHQNNPKHPERKNYTMKVLATGLNEREARLMEQLLISTYTVAYLDNGRREIAPSKVGKYNNYFSSVYNIITGATEESLVSLLLE